jgi:hypothetical protein
MYNQPFKLDLQPSPPRRSTAATLPLGPTWSRCVAPPLLRVLLTTLAVFCAGCGGEPAPSDAIEPKLSAIQAEVFAIGCASSSCHSTNSHAGSLILEPGKSHQNLVGTLVDQPGAQKEGRLRVKAGDPDASFLLQKCTAGLSSDYGAVMPFGDTVGLSKRKLDAIRAWIAAGALDN